MLPIYHASLILAGLSQAWAYSQVIHRDVCVIGGGSSGTHAAIELQRQGKSVAVIEKESRLGGHVDTYVDPATGKTHDYGVVVFNNISAVRSYFKYWDIPLAPVSTSGGGVTRSVNFDTGMEVLHPSPLFGPAVTSALKRYLKLLLKYPGIAQEWNIPSPVPEELLMSFGKFLVKYDLEALAPLAYIYNQGAGDVLAQPTLYMLKYFNLGQVESTLNTFIRNGLDNNQLIYDKAKAQLGKSAFVNSHPTKITRHSDHVDVQIATPRGAQLIRAKKLLVSIEPLQKNLNFMDLDHNEMSIFGQFNNSYYYDVIVQNTGIPDNTTLDNSNPAAPYKIPAMPGLYSVSSTPFPNTHAVYYGASHQMTDAAVKQDILASIARARAGLGYPAPQAKPKITQFNAHVPFVLTVSTDAVRGGFYKKLQALQGKKNTFYTGAAWNVQASSDLWAFNEQIILPKIRKSLGGY